jgi:membrane-associated protease RseP (regulator of RpoE activity)
MNFIVIDLVLLGIFALLLFLFLYKNRKNVGKEGPMILYRTSWGIKLIEKVGEKYKKTLKALSYVSIFCGGVLMILMLYLIVSSVWSYLTTTISTLISAPPIMPLIPYFPQLFGLESFFPPFYFTYFILAIAIVATVHEMSHGIFAKRYGVKIKSTGFAFLKYFPALFGAFVEQDEKQMQRKSKFEQMSILSAGVFANMITVVIFGLLMALFFFSLFSPAGVVISNYAFGVVNATSLNLEELIASAPEEGLLDIEVDGEKYVLTKSELEAQQENDGLIVLFYDSPLIRNNIGGTIKEFNGIAIEDLSHLSSELSKISPGEKVLMKTKQKGEGKEYEVTLREHPEVEDKSFLGFSTFAQSENKIFSMFVAYRLKDLYDTSSELNWFIYYLFWWIVIINLLVALFNMLPLGILDGGRFLYLGIWSVTGNKKFGRRIFIFFTYFLLALLALMMAKWVLRFI